MGQGGHHPKGTQVRREAGTVQKALFEFWEASSLSLSTNGLRTSRG
jgi:hypothetical protein